ncbi:MAG: hypothetical protein ACFWUC_04430 [Oscillospiraceae bacterium]|jgi:C4-dicarboxylate transporter, DctQ subunit
MEKALNYGKKLERAIVVIMFAIMVAAIFMQVVNRNIFQVPVSGFEEAAKYAMVYMVLLGTEMGLRDGTQIAVTGVQDSLSGIKKKIRLYNKCWGVTNRPAKKEQKSRAYSMKKL